MESIYNMIYIQEYNVRYLKFFLIVLFLSIFQTIAGVGILVLGTPILLLLGLEMVQIMTLLLPLSILNSFVNIFYLKQKEKNIKIDNTMRNYFFLVCLPGIFFWFSYT